MAEIVGKQSCSPNTSVKAATLTGSSFPDQLYRNLCHMVALKLRDGQF